MPKPKCLDGLQVRIYLCQDGTHTDVGHLAVRMPRFRDEWSDVLTAVAMQTVKRILSGTVPTAEDQSVLIEMFPVELVSLDGKDITETEQQRLLFSPGSIQWQTEA